MPSRPEVLIEASPEKIRRLRELQAEVRSRSRRTLQHYYDDPVAFAHDCFDGLSLVPYQEEVLSELTRHKRISVRGPHGLGKSSFSAIAVLWFALTRDAVGVDWKAPTTASAWRQLEQYLWPEIHKWARAVRWDRIGREPFTRDELLRLNLKLRYGSAFAVASDVPAMIEGVHADSVLYVFDESKAIPAGTFDAAEGAFSGAGPDTGLEAFAIANSTPGEPSGRFYEIHQRRPGFEDWWTRHVSLDEAIAAGRVSRDWAEQRALQWGETSAIYANRVLGEFHSSDEDSVIPLAWVEAANERHRAWMDAGSPDTPGREVIGVDVARSGADQTVLAIRNGDVVRYLERYRLADTMETTGHVAKFASRSPLAIVDVIGIGAGVVDRLREQHFNVIGFNASERATQSDRSGEVQFLNQRSQGWWHLRELLDPAYGPVIALPEDNELIGDLCAPKYKYNSSGKLQIEAKDDIKKRIGRSPDAGDAVVMAFASGGGPPIAARAIPWADDPGLSDALRVGSVPSRRRDEDGALLLPAIRW